MKVAGVTVATYAHNDRGERVRKAIASGPTTHYHFDLDGTLIAESNGGTGAVQREYVVLGGQTIAIADPGTPVTPTAVTVDNTDPGASWVGTWPVSTVGTGYEGVNYAVKDGGTVADSFTWTPTLAATGAYQVQVKHPINPGRQSIVGYTMHHAEGTDGFTRNQRGDGGQWNLVGAFPLAPGQNHRLVLSGEAEKLPATDIVVDNTYPGNVVVGAWSVAINNPGFYDSNYGYHAAGSTGDSFTWPAAVPAAGRYKVYAWWTLSGGSATSATYTVHHAGGTTGVTVNQTQNVKQWNYLGDFLIDPAAGHKVVLTDNASGFVLADAIRFVRDAGLELGEEVVVDNTTAGTSWVGTWPTTTVGSGYQNSNFQYNTFGTGVDSFTWPAQITATGAYKVYAKWFIGSGGAPNAKYTVTHAGGTTLVTVNQLQSQGQWFYLGRFNLAPGSGHKVVLSDNASSGNVHADAIRFVRDAGVVPSDEVVVDNTSPGTVPVGTWATSTTISGFYGANYAFNATGTGADSFTWPASVGTTGLYRVYARWMGTAGTIAPDAKYTVHHTGGTTTRTMNQQQNQATWNLLGTFTLDPAAGHKVVLSDEATAGLNVIADAIRFVRIGDALTVQADAVRFVPNNAESLLYVHADRLGTAQRITDQAGAVVWDAVYLPFGTAHSITGSVAYNQRFPGQYFDAETGLHYNYWRDYDPRIGRYLQADPIGLAGGVNRYVYVNANSTNFVDRDGRVGVPGAIYGAIAGGIGGYISSGTLAGTLAGAGAGALVGAVNPWASSAVGGAAGAGIASLLGQAAGNLIAGKELDDLCNYDFSAAAGAALGGALGGPANSAIGRAGPAIRRTVIGSTLGSRTVIRAPAKLLGAAAEGGSVGLGEWLGTGLAIGMCGCRR